MSHPERGATGQRPATALDLLEKRLREGRSYSEIGEWCIQNKNALMIELMEANGVLPSAPSESTLITRAIGERIDALVVECTRAGYTRNGNELQNKIEGMREALAIVENAAPQATGPASNLSVESGGEPAGAAPGTASAETRMSYLPGLRLAQQLLEKNGFEKSAKALGVQIAILETRPDLDAPPSAPSSEAVATADDIIEWIAGQTKVQHCTPAWCLTDAQIRELKGRYSLADTKGFVSTVPDHCDRIVWKGRYYHLDQLSAAPAAPVAEGEFYELACTLREEADAMEGPDGVRALMRKASSALASVQSATTRKLLEDCVASLAGYRREHNDGQHCDAEKAARAFLAADSKVRPE